MAVEDWGSLNRWLLAKRGGQWFLDCPMKQRRTFKGEHFFSTFTEAHAAYLDAVTCESTYDTGTFVGLGVVRCVKTRGHKGRWHECASGGWRIDGGGAVFSNLKNGPRIRGAA